MERGILSLVATVFASLYLFSTGCAQSQHTDRTESGNLYLIMQNGKVGFIDSKGRVVIKPQFLKANSFREGLTAVAIGNRQDYKVAFIDTTGRIVIETDASPSEEGFSSGVAVMLMKSSSSSFYIDKTGKWIAGYYPEAKDCTEGLCAVRMESMGPKHWGYINTSGAVVIKGQCDSAQPFSDGIARVGIMTGKPHVENGTPGVDFKTGYIDRSGKMITPPQFDQARDFSEGMAQVNLGNKWGYINQTGDVVIAPQYEETQAFKDGLARVKLNGLWGFIDKSGKMIFTAKFESVDDFYEDWAAASMGPQAFYVDRGGRSVLRTLFDKVGRFRNGIAIVRLNNKSGLINKEGKIIINPQFYTLEMVSDELIRVVVEDKGFGYMNYRGEFIWKPTY